MSAFGEAPGPLRERDGVPEVLESALDAGEIPEVLRPYYRERLVKALMWEHAEMLDLFGVAPTPEELECAGCRSRRLASFGGAVRRRRFLAAALLAGALAALLFALYAFGSPYLGRWWGIVGFAAAGGALFFSWLCEAGRGSAWARR